MIQGRRGLRLALEARQSLRVLANFVGQELQGDKALETGVFGLVDHAHPTTTEFFENAVMRDCLFDHELSGAKKLLDDRALVPISQFVLRCMSDLSVPQSDAACPPLGMTWPSGQLRD